MKIIVKIINHKNEDCGFYTLTKFGNNYYWAFSYIYPGEDTYPALFKKCEEHYSCDLSFNFDFEEGDLERLR